MSQTFDRIGTHIADEPDGTPVDVQGKAALFSGAAAVPSLGNVAITCSGCHGATVVSYSRALRLSLPSVHLPLLRREYPTWMRCPACLERHWVKVRLR
jgi:hypothetical protein